MKSIIAIIFSVIFLTYSQVVLAGGWDKEKGLDRVSIQGELVCLGCSLKKLSGANAQCSLYSQHDIGVQLADGTLWSIVDNAKGHDIIRSHGLAMHKKATISGWLYPNAHHVEIDSIDVQGVSPKQIAQTAWEEDQKIAKALSSRKVGETPKPPEHSH